MEKENKKLTFEVIGYSRNILMAIAIVWIVFVHSRMPPPENIVLKVLWYLFFDFGAGMGVNIFFILSGFGLMYSNMKRCVYSSFSNCLHYLTKRLVKIIPLYTIVFVIWYCLFHYSDGSLVDFISKFTITELFINGFREYWFVHAILVMYLFFPFIAYLFDKYNEWIIFLLLLITFIGIEFAFYYINKALYLNIEIFITRIPCFIIGNMLGVLSIKKYAFSLRLFIAFLSIFLVSVICFFVMNHYDVGGLRAIRYLYTVMATSFVCALSFLLSRIHEKLKVLKWLGTITYEIYLLHLLIYAILRTFTAITNVWLLLFITLVSSIALAVLVSFVTNTINSFFANKCRKAAP